MWQIEFIGDGNAVVRRADDTEFLIPAGDMAVVASNEAAFAALRDAIDCQEATLSADELAKGVLAYLLANGMAIGHLEVGQSA